MNKEEAIKLLICEKVCVEDVDGNIGGERVRQAYDMAIEALQDDWIPVSERLPEKNGNYIVSLEDAVDTYARFFNGKWFMPLFGSIAREYGEYEVIAWMPLPEPYKGGDVDV